MSTTVKIVTRQKKREVWRVQSVFDPCWRAFAFLLGPPSTRGCSGCGSVPVPFLPERYLRLFRTCPPVFTCSGVLWQMPASASLSACVSRDVRSFSFFNASANAGAVAKTRRHSRQVAVAHLPPPLATRPLLPSEELTTAPNSLHAWSDVWGSCFPATLACMEVGGPDGRRVAGGLELPRPVAMCYTCYTCTEKAPNAWHCRGSQKTQTVAVCDDGCVSLCLWISLSMNPVCIYVHMFWPRPVGCSVASAVQPVLPSRGRCFMD